MPTYIATAPQELLAASDNDIAMFCSLAQIFLETAPELWLRMEQAGAAGAPGAFVAAAHSLRGITVLVGAHALTALLLVLERQAASGACAGPAALAPARDLLAVVCGEVRCSVEACTAR